MTEERMICTLDPEVLGRNLFWKPVEPAPPKDWRPYCYSDSPIGVCMDKNAEPEGRLGERCKICPYRKME